MARRGGNADRWPRRIRESAFAVLTHGVFDNPPASGLRDFLVQRGARVTFVVHPLQAEHGDVHHVVEYADGRELRRRSHRLAPRPPLTFATDLLTPVWPAAVDGWFGFNNLLAARGIAARRLGRADRVVYWAVDFVPDRFGEGSRLSRAYDRLDEWVCRRADWRVDLSPPALAGRTERHGLHRGPAAPGRVVPVGVWLDRTPRVPDDGWRAGRVVFLGHLVPRQGVDRLIRAVALARRDGAALELEIAGNGPQEGELRALADAEGVAEHVRFLGFISDHTEVEAFLASGSVAAAPYETSADSFTRFADPSKLKSYLAAGLPIVLTDVPHNAAELAERAGAEVAAFEPRALADSLRRCLESPEGWGARRAAALAYARGFDWSTVLGAGLADMGFVE